MPKTPKKQGVTPPPPSGPASPQRSFTPMRVAALAVVAAAIGLFAYVRSGRLPADQGDQANQPPPPQTASATPGTSTEESAPPPANAKFGPHRQDVLPPLPFGPSPPARPPDVVRAVYKFAAEHPEVLGYVPCYCGCERSGHRGNDDCFVTSRAANGDVRSWEPHGMT
jgi:hypothetical protein